MTLTARRYENATDMRAGAHAVRMRLLRPGNAVKEVPMLPRPAGDRFAGVTPDSPLWMQKQIHFDAHVRQWEWHIANHGGEQRRYIVRRCKELGLKYSDFDGLSRRSDVNGKRQIIWYELRREFHLSYPQIGAMSGGRDHTTIRSGIQRVAKIMDTDVPGSLSDRARIMDDRALNSRMRQAYAKGATQAEIAKAYGVAEGALQKVIHIEKWTRGSRDVAKKYDLAGLFSAYYGGLPIKEISRQFKVPERTLQGLRKRLGWAKRDQSNVKEKAS